MTHLPHVSIDMRAYFLNQLRDARTQALRDAEGFRDILFALEGLGLVLSGGEANGNPGLGTYRPVLTELAREGALFVDTDQLEAFHPTFEALYTAVKDARNDAMHQGAYARHLTHHSVQLAIILEDALMASLSKVTHFMVRAPVTAEPWHPVSFVRQQMLENSFSYLPIEIDIQGKPSWRLISEQAVARYLRAAASNKERKDRLYKAVSKAITLDPYPLVLNEAVSVEPTDEIRDVVPQLDGHPLLVHDGARLVGILTAFDLL